MPVDASGYRVDFMNDRQNLTHDPALKIPDDELQTHYQTKYTIEICDFSNC